MEIELNRFTPAEQATFRLRALYEQAGYRKYRASRFEEYALYQEYQRFLPDAQVITFTDLDGKLRAIKPDVTLSIAKTAQPAAGECKRFYYNEEVCRPSRESHTFQTIHQMGLESMGAVDADEQAAVVRLALQSLAALDVPTVLEISHMGYLTGLLDALHVPAEARAKLLDFLRAKNAHELRTGAGRGAGRIRRCRVDRPARPARPAGCNADRRPRRLPVRDPARGAGGIAGFAECAGRGGPRHPAGPEHGRRNGVLQRPCVHRLRRGHPVRGAQGRTV